MTLCHNDLIKLFKLLSMPQLSIYENTSKILINNTNKGNKSRSLNKQNKS